MLLTASAWGGAGEEDAEEDSVDAGEDQGRRARAWRI